MPTYDYECQKCGHEFEIFQSMTDKPRQRCPVCRGKVKRLIGAGAGVIFKGSGFYQTDYRSKSYHDAAKKAEDASKPSGTKSDTGTKSASKDKPAPAKKSASSPEKA